VSREQERGEWCIYPAAHASSKTAKAAAGAAAKSPPAGCRSAWRRRIRFARATKSKEMSAEEEGCVSSRPFRPCGRDVSTFHLKDLKIVTRTIACQPSARRKHAQLERKRKKRREMAVRPTQATNRDIRTQRPAGVDEEQQPG